MEPRCSRLSVVAYGLLYFLRLGQRSERVDFVVCLRCAMSQISEHEH